jgi:hypothetical protein
MSDSDQRLASLNEAREVFVRALKTHEHFVYKLGYEAGFAAGWDAVVRRMSQAKPDFSMADEKQELSELQQHHESEIAARDTLMSIVAQTPGLERHEIIETARKNLTTLSERTLRTAMQRLKETGDLRADNGRWYIAQKETTAARPVLSSDFDE